MPRYYLFRDPAEDEYIFDCLKNFTAAQKEKLTLHELKIFRNNKTLRRFVNTASKDQRDLILAKGGITFVKLYVDKNQEKQVNFTRLSKQFREATQHEMIDTIKANKMFAISSRNVIHLAFLVAQNNHSPYYYLNQHYHKVYNAIESVKIEDMGKLKGDVRTEKIIQTDKSRNILAQLVREVRDLHNYIRVILKLDELSIDILLYLFLFQHTQVIADTVIKNIGRHWTGPAIKTKLAELANEGYLDRILAQTSRHNSKKYTYIIAESGILLICKILESLASKVLDG